MWASWKCVVSCQNGLVVCGTDMSLPLPLPGSRGSGSRRASMCSRKMLIFGSSGVFLWSLILVTTKDFETLLEVLEACLEGMRTVFRGYLQRVWRERVSVSRRESFQEFLQFVSGGPHSVFQRVPATCFRCFQRSPQCVSGVTATCFRIIHNKVQRHIRFQVWLLVFGISSHSFPSGDCFGSLEGGLGTRKRWQSSGKILNLSGREKALQNREGLKVRGVYQERVEQGSFFYSILQGRGCQKRMRSKSEVVCKSWKIHSFRPP